MTSTRPRLRKTICVIRQVGNIILAIETATLEMEALDNVTQRPLLKTVS